MRERIPTAFKSRVAPVLIDNGLSGGKLIEIAAAYAVERTAHVKR